MGGKREIRTYEADEAYNHGGPVTEPLPTYTDDEAFRRHLHPADAFRAFAIPSGTIRAWASAGHIRAHGIGPRGAKLYFVPEVSAYSMSIQHRPRMPRLSSVA